MENKQRKSLGRAQLKCNAILYQSISMFKLVLYTQTHKPHRVLQQLI